MPGCLQDIVQFRGDRLFNGAVNIGWFHSDRERTRAAAEAFVFHGPSYHGVSQDDVGVSHGHRLQDTASFARSLIKRCYGLEEQPFTLAIAGYGTGKSHLALTLSTLLSSPDGDVANAVLKGVERADEGIGSEIRAILSEAARPCLVVALNGMQNFDLTTEVTRQILQQINSAGLDSRPLVDLRPRFAHAANLIRMAETNKDLVDALLEACDTDALENILNRLEQQDETVYASVHRLFAARNIQITALGGESIRDVIDVACRQYCGPERTFRCLAVIFDEFGRYTEFATVRSHIAGSGVLQDLFEGIQENAGSAVFAGFIQFDLNAYVQRVVPEHRNEILRYVTRYQAANRVYLSINLETLIASLIEKGLPDELSRRFDNDAARRESERIIYNVGQWFPQSRNHRLWRDSSQFHTVVRQGCWPLSAYSTWFLFHLVAAGKHLQERSAIALLGDVFGRFSRQQLDGDSNWALAPVDFWSDSLQHELITSEESGQQGSITHAYASVSARHEAKIDESLIRLLRAVVLASKMGLKVQNRDDAINALSDLAGLQPAVAGEGVRQLQQEYNVLEWDDSFKEFDILGDAVPRTQFLSFVRHRVASAYDEAGRAAMFASKAASWCDLLADVECDFAEHNKITTREWRYAGVTSNLDVLPMHVKLAADKWSQAIAVNEPRGTIIYCYVEPSRDPDAVAADVGKLLRAAAKQLEVSALPILVVLLCDTENVLGQAIGELAVLDESLTAEDRVRFGNLIPAHQEKMRSVVRAQIESMLKQRIYLTASKEPLESRRLALAGTELFSRVYQKVLAFPFDGFSTAGGNAADSCLDLTAELLIGKLDYDGVLGKPSKVRNRAVAVLNDAWGIFAQNGNVRTRPTHAVIRSLTEKWDGLLAAGERRIPLQSSLRQLCAPPYGANVASAGLFLGVFVAARSEKVCIARDGQQYAVAQFVQDGLFRGRFVDFGALHGVDLVQVGNASSEWETLLDEWEQAESHLEKRECLMRALVLRNRVPVPPALRYRQIHLQEQSEESVRKLLDATKQTEDALQRIENGMRHEDASLIARGAAELKKIIDAMIKAKPDWSDQQILQIQPSIDDARQRVIQSFPQWLSRQVPKDETPDAVGDFKHRMLRLTHTNLKNLGLDALCAKLNDHTRDVIKNVEAEAETHRLLTEVGLWLTTHGNATRFVRVAELRALRKVGEEYSSKLRKLKSQRQASEVTNVRNRLLATLGLMRDQETNLMARASELWKSKLLSIDDLRQTEGEVTALVAAFENCPDDLDDLQAMRDALHLYQGIHRKLSDDGLSWKDYESLIEKTVSETRNTLDSEEIPWPPEETIAAIASIVTKAREDNSLSFTRALETDAFGVPTMSASDANRVHSRASSPPPFITEPHLRRLEKVVLEAEKRLDSLKVDWLVERYKELSTNARVEFHRKIESANS